MRGTKMVDFLIALVLLVASVSAALAENRPARPDFRGMSQKACRILQNEGYDVDYRECTVDGRCQNGVYSLELTTPGGGAYAVSLTQDGTVKALVNHRGRQGTPEDNPHLDGETLEKIEQKVDSFLKKNNPALRENIGKLNVIHSLTEGDETHVEVVDSRNRMYISLQLTPETRVWYFNEN